MPVKRYQTKSCCGKNSIIFETELPIRKFHAELFRKEKFDVPAGFYKAGVLYARRGKLVVTGPYNSRRINVKCYGPDCEKQLDDLEVLLDRIVHTKKL